MSAALGAAGRTGLRWLQPDRLAPDLPLVLTLFLLLAHPLEPHLPGTVLAAAGLMWPALRRSRALWLGIALYLGAISARDWYLIDNHRYLIAYWCLAILCCLSFARADFEAALRRNARLLLGLSMLLAVGWKLASASYVDGSFFEYTLLTDVRFGGFARLVGGVSELQLSQNRLLVASLQGPVAALPQPVLRGTEGVSWLAGFVTWWTIAVEASIALLMLVPFRRSLLRHARNVALLLFVLTTYPVATVLGFGWILNILAIAQCERDEVTARLAFCVAFLLIPVFRLPFSELLAPLLP